MVCIKGLARDLACAKCQVCFGSHHFKYYEQLACPAHPSKGWLGGEDRECGVSLPCLHLAISSNSQAILLRPSPPPDSVLHPEWASR